MKTVTFVPRKVAEIMGDDGSILISIVHSDQPLPEHQSEWYNIHTFVFDDITSYVSGMILFDVDMASEITRIVKNTDKNIVVHCEAGMSRSAAIAKWIYDNGGYNLYLHPSGVGTIKHYNKFVYSVMDASVGNDMAAYYREMELNAFINPDD